MLCLNNFVVFYRFATIFILKYYWTNYDKWHEFYDNLKKKKKKEGASCGGVLLLIYLFQVKIYRSIYILQCTCTKLLCYFFVLFWFLKKCLLNVENFVAEILLVLLTDLISPTYISSQFIFQTATQTVF